MPYVVIHQDLEGSRSYVEVEDLDVAAVEVERLRNDAGVADVRLCRLNEIEIDFRPYYRVELGEVREDDIDDAEIEKVLAKIGGPRLGESEVDIDVSGPLARAAGRHSAFG